MYLARTRERVRMFAKRRLCKTGCFVSKGSFNYRASQDHRWFSSCPKQFWIYRWKGEAFVFYFGRTRADSPASEAMEGALMEASMVVWTALAASWQAKELQAAIPTSVASMQVLQLDLQRAHLRALRNARGCLLSVCFVRPDVLFPKEVFTIELTKITGLVLQLSQTVLKRQMKGEALLFYFACTGAPERADVC